MEQKYIDKKIMKLNTYGMFTIKTFNSPIGQTYLIYYLFFVVIFYQIDKIL